MSPTLREGDYVVTLKPRRIAAGLIYVVDHSDLGRIIKRLERMEKGRAVLGGDNQTSTPSSVIAPVAIDRLTGRAVLAITKTGLKRL